jgi:restriction system protein
MSSKGIPQNADLALIVVMALNQSGGEASNEAIREFVIQYLELTSNEVEELHSGKRTKLEYKLAWARTIAKQKGLISPAGKSRWKLT